MTEQRVIDYRLTEIGRQNWEVCHRMLIHDLLDIRKDCPQVDALLSFYSIEFMPNGGYSMALPRAMLLKLKKKTSVKKKIKKKK